MLSAGTLAYAAPEVLMDETSNLKSDIYSFGMVLWEVRRNHAILLALKLSSRWFVHVAEHALWGFSIIAASLLDCDALTCCRLPLLWCLNLCFSV